MKRSVRAHSEWWRNEHWSERSDCLLSLYSRGKQGSGLSCPRQGSQLCPFLPALWSQLFYMTVCAREEAENMEVKCPVKPLKSKYMQVTKYSLSDQQRCDPRFCSSPPHYSAQLKTQGRLHLQTSHHPPQGCGPLLQACPVSLDTLWFSWALVLLGHQSIL